MSSTGFEITIDIGNTSTEFIDVSLDLNNFCLYRKPNSKAYYINYNHSKNVRNTIPKMIEKNYLNCLRMKKFLRTSKAYTKMHLTKLNKSIKII